MDSLIKAYMEHKVPYKNFMSTAQFIIFAGFHTTAGAITGLLWNLAQHQDVQKKLRETLVAEGRDAHYMLWCIREALRWDTSVPLGTGRMASEDMYTSDGIMVPKGSYVSPSIYSIHRDNNIWPEPDKFKPERWANSSSFHPAAFMAFGLGLRNCPSGNSAIQEIKVMLDALGRRYQIDKCERTVDRYEVSSPGIFFSTPDHPVVVKLTPLNNVR